MSAAFIISLDFELPWGVRDHADRRSYGANVRGARDVIPRMLDLFAALGVRATWATVGFLFCESKDELLASLPGERPNYRHPRLSSYSYLHDVGDDERRDPYHFAPSLIRQIAQAPGQEIGTHTLSHFYCLEDGATLTAFEADLAAALALAVRRGVAPRSIVFPRNQYAPAHLDICRRLGLTAYRGNPAHWAYRPSKGMDQTLLRRALRLVDAYTGIVASQGWLQREADLTNVPASRFLRPCAGRLAALHPVHLTAIERGMSHAARAGLIYHLWWHPHNFGVEQDANLAGLRRLLLHFKGLRERFGMVSRAMGDLA